MAERAAPLSGGAAQVDALEDGGHLGGCDFDMVARRHREAEDSAFQPLHPYRKSVSVPIEQLEPIAAAVTKDEEMTGERVLTNDRRGQGRQPVEPPTHVCRLSGEEDANRREGD